MKPLLWLFLKFLPLWLLAMVIGFTIAWWQRGREARRQIAGLKERLSAQKEQTAIATQQALESSESYSRLAAEIKDLKQNQQPASEAQAEAEARAELTNQLAEKNDEITTNITAHKSRKRRC